MDNDLSLLPWADGQLHRVENYWEAVGVMTALKAGIQPNSLRRPLGATRVETKKIDPQTSMADEADRAVDS